MRLTHRSFASGFVGLAMTMTLACDDATAPPVEPAGAIEVSVSTTITDTEADPDGYTVRLNADMPRPIGVNGTVRIDALRRGRYSVRLDGLASNCVIDGSNPRAVDVAADGAVATMAFRVICDATGGRGEWDYLSAPLTSSRQESGRLPPAP